MAIWAKVICRAILGPEAGEADLRPEAGVAGEAVMVAGQGCHGCPSALA